ncbi:MAG: hypothetical protein D3908_12000 [Candidatus Electrothrix sp. AUS4]|nr:hypothetical protein [Candidatus Electrothrix sp. AUS4]
MKRAITGGLLVLGSGLLLLWSVQQDGESVSFQDVGGELTGQNTSAVVKVQPVMPPVIELVGEEQGAQGTGQGGGSDAASVLELAMGKSPVDETDALQVPASFSSIGLALEIAGQGMLTTESESAKKEDDVVEKNQEEKSYDPSVLDAVLCAEKKADSSALKVLQIGREMSLKRKEVVQGGCWNYVDTVYNRAGYSEQKRQVVFQGGRETELYADREMIRPGDWLFYINHDYREARHSAIFIDWLDYEQQIGLMLSYGGEGRGVPARYSAYDLRQVYNIIRPLDE